MKKEYQKQVLFSYLFDSFPEISETYCKANKKEKEEMKEVNKKFLKKISGTRA